MKNFLCKINNNKKWIRSIMAAICFVVFCFPPIQTNIGAAKIKVPYIIYNVFFPTTSKAILANLAKAHSSHTVRYYVHLLTVGSISVALLYATIVLAIISVYNTFKGKEFHFVWALLTASLNFLIRGFVYLGVSMGKHHYVFRQYPLGYVIYALLILDAIYLLIERKYRRSSPSLTSR